MNVYDFDNTIYRGDSSADFYLHCFRRFRAVRRHAPSLIMPGISFLLCRLKKTAWKQTFFGFLRHVPEIELEVLLFWDRNQHKIKPFYVQRQRLDDLVISASPEFLLRPILHRIGVGALLGSRVDMKTGRFDGENCHGNEKVARFMAAFPGATIDDFYSDSHADDPLAHRAANAYWVAGDRIRAWRQ